MNEIELLATKIVLCAYNIDTKQATKIAVAGDENRLCALGFLSAHFDDGP